MSKDLATYINSLPIFTFLLPGGVIVIGRLIESHTGAVSVSAVCSIETYVKDNSINQTLMPLIPLSLEQISVIYRSQIILQTPASFALKKLYCDALLRSKVNQLSGLNSSSSMSLETTDQNSNSDFFKDRWNN